MSLPPDNSDDNFDEDISDDDTNILHLDSDGSSCSQSESEAELRAFKEKQSANNLRPFVGGKTYNNRRNFINYSSSSDEEEINLNDAIADVSKLILAMEDAPTSERTLCGNSKRGPISDKVEDSKVEEAILEIYETNNKKLNFEQDSYEKDSFEEEVFEESDKEFFDDINFKQIEVEDDEQDEHEHEHEDEDEEEEVEEEAEALTEIYEECPEDITLSHSHRSQAGEIAYNVLESDENLDTDFDENLSQSQNELLAIPNGAVEFQSEENPLEITNTSNEDFNAQKALAYFESEEGWESKQATLQAAEHILRNFGQTRPASREHVPELDLENYEKVDFKQLDNILKFLSTQPVPTNANDESVQITEIQAEHQPPSCDEQQSSGSLKKVYNSKIPKLYTLSAREPRRVESEPKVESNLHTEERKIEYVPKSFKPTSLKSNCKKFVNAKNLPKPKIAVSPHPILPVDAFFTGGYEFDDDEEDEHGNVNNLLPQHFNLHKNIKQKFKSGTPASFHSDDSRLHVNLKRPPSSTNKLSFKNLGRKSFSFTNERLREIERQNRILLNKMMHVKPTVTTINSGKPTHPPKITPIPPVAARTTNAAVNRKKQQRRIDIDNTVLRRKLEEIGTRRRIY